MIELSPQGFEEVVTAEGIELAAYADGAGEARLCERFGGGLAEPVEEGWEDAWKRFHQPVRIGPLWIGPPWEAPPAGAVAVVIDPGRAFGTGAHPTTRLCLELLLAQRRTGVVDLGCGSGVLAIAAARLGFGSVTAVDRDPSAVAAARVNACRNGVAVRVLRRDVLVGSHPPAALAVANMTLADVERLRPVLRARRLIASGYPAGEQPRLDGWRTLERRRLEGWAADLLERL